jgi:chromosome segregation ATPase
MKRLLSAKNVNYKAVKKRICMNEEPTRNLTGAPSFEERIFAELSAMRAEMSATRTDFGNRFGAMETRFGTLESRFDALETRFERVESRFDLLETRFNRMETRFDALETRLGSVEGGLGTVEARLTSLDDKVDARLRETRPVWEGVQARLGEMGSTLNDINRQLKTIITDSFKLRVRVESLEESSHSSAT